MERPPATISVDMDPVDLHLIGYGHRGLPADASIYSLALPRLLAIFERLAVKATFFVVGRDAPAQARALAEIAGAGHELASHSLSHPAPFERLAPAMLRLELSESRRLIEDAAGSAVVGFRAPNWDTGPRLLRPLIDAGYRYDASAFPSPLLAPARLMLALKSRDPRAALSLRLWPASLARRPHRWRPGPSGPCIYQFPISVSRFLRVPIYHTMRYFTSEIRFLARLDRAAGAAETLFYPLHAVDALGLAEDGVDRRLAGHPGMGEPLDRKLDLLRESLKAIGERFEPITYQSQLQRLEGREDEPDR